MELTQEQLNILAYAIVDPNEWVSNAVEKVGEDSVLAKIAENELLYKTAIENSDYRNRAQRDADEMAAEQAFKGAK